MPGALLGGVVAAAVALMSAVFTTAWWASKRRQSRQNNTNKLAAATTKPSTTLHRTSISLGVHAAAFSTGSANGSCSAGEGINDASPHRVRNTITIQHIATSSSPSPPPRASLPPQATSSTLPPGSTVTGTGGQENGTNGTNATEPDTIPQEVTLFEQLGSGAFGTVYRREWEGKPVAVKVLQTACTSGSKELASFRHEVAVLSRLRHPNIIAFLAACTVPPDICIIEELAEGSLHAKIHGIREHRRHTPMALRDVLSVGIDVAEAMAYLHPRIVHRDLKSQNVLLDAQGRAKVADFGIAKFKDRTFVSTQNGQAGTPAYMAPELFDGAPATEKVDVYSFAILMWEMLTGEVPWGKVPSPMQIIYYVGVLAQRPTIPPECYPPLRDLIEKCWSESPAARPPFTSILASLQKMLVDAEAGGQASFRLPPPASPTDVQAPSPPPDSVNGDHSGGFGGDGTQTSSGELPSGGSCGNAGAS